ncbi:MAG: hypothetical protein J0H41_12690 [Rhizobiales bacterium]|nr:hypothetical protein [Hyphomicrobiales bacterium]
MASAILTLSSDELLAEYVRLDSFKGVLEQRLGIGPDLIAILIRDGQIVQASHGAHISVGGLWQSVKNALGGQHAMRLLIADAKPFQLTASADAVTQDHVQVAGELTIDFQANPEKPANILGFMKERTAVAKADVLTRLVPHLGDRALQSLVGRVAALDLRGNVALQDKLQADVMAEVERIVGDLGLMVRAVSLRWGFNEEEIAAIQKRSKEREQEALEQDFQILTRAIEREGQSTVLQLRTDLDIEKVKGASEAELRRMVLDQEVDFVDARETAVRVEEMKVLQHEIALNKTERLDRLQVALEAADNEVALARSRGERRGVERDIETGDRRHDVDLARIQSERREVERGIEEADRRHQIVVARIHADIRQVERSTEELDRKQALALHRLEELQNLEIAGKAHDLNLRKIRDLQDSDLDGVARRQDIDLKGRDSDHRRQMESTKQNQQTDLAKMQMMKDMSPEQIMAINAGLSPAVANVLVEQARARGGDNAEKMALMREMVDAAKDARVDSAAQARHFFEHAMQGAAGVAAGVGAGAAAARGDAPAAGGVTGATTECPACHRVIPVTDRHCRYCGRQMRA